MLLRKLIKIFGSIFYRNEVGLFGGKAGLTLPLPLNPYGVRGVTGNAGVSGRGDSPVEWSGSVSDRYDENDSSRNCRRRKFMTEVLDRLMKITCIL